MFAELKDTKTKTLGCNRGNTLTKESKGYLHRPLHVAIHNNMPVTSTEL